MHRDTIAALSSAPGTGAVAMLRISGPNALEVAGRVAPSLPLEPLARRAYFVPLIDLDGQVD